ncbi:MAG: hypothetical protein ACLT1J_05765 [Mediterraneibacter gnavus]
MNTQWELYFLRREIERQKIQKQRKRKAAHMDCRYKWTACIGISCRRDFYGTIL